MRTIRLSSAQNIRNCIVYISGFSNISMNNIVTLGAARAKVSTNITIIVIVPAPLLMCFQFEKSGINDIPQLIMGVIFDNIFFLG